MNSKPENGSITVLRECIELQKRKSEDYQNTASTVKQADYYRLGVDSIYDMMHTKMLRLLSLLEASKAGVTQPNFESLEDTAKDLINYSSFFTAYIRHQIDGQSKDHNIFNQPTNVNSVTIQDISYNTTTTSTSRAE